MDRRPGRVDESRGRVAGCEAPVAHPAWRHGDLDCCARHSLAPHASMVAVAIMLAILLSVSACSSRCVVYPFAEALTRSALTDGLTDG